MLADYIEQYKEAMANEDKKTMREIEKDLAKLGMDRMTLRLLVEQKGTNNGNNSQNNL